MATVTSDNNKYSLKFSAVDGTGTEVSTRTISGLNVGGGSGSGNGPQLNAVLGNFIPRFIAFSQGEFSNWRWTTEQDIQLD